MQVISALGFLCGVVLPFVAQAFVISVPGKLVPGLTSVTYNSQAGDPPGNLTFWIAHPGGVGGFTVLALNVKPTNVATKYQIELSNNTVGGQWRISAGPANRNASGIFAASDIFVVKDPTVGSASNSQSASATSSGFPPSHTTNSKPTASTKSGKSSPPVGLIIGVTFGATAVLLILAFLAFLHIRKRRRRYNTDSEIHTVIDPAFLSHSGTTSSNDSVSQSIRPFTSDAGVHMTNSVSALSSKAARVRQEYLTNQMRAVQKQLEELQGVTSAPLLKHTTSSEGDGDELRRQNEILQGRIRTLEEQLHSSWALGLSDEPPPGYGE
ncbi:hypothetical protein DFH09DRAFT_1188065 [Mycena vulgaris]|nr:hypothetical protein DFH09DRAFT_1188065 [Mycena vulgaris]